MVITRHQGVPIRHHLKTRRFSYNKLNPYKDTRVENTTIAEAEKTSERKREREREKDDKKRVVCRFLRDIVKRN